MSMNVRCTGRRYDDPAHPDRYQLTDCAIGPGPRPWKGYRHAYLVPGRKGRWGDPTKAPCPRCGGKVELIPREGA